MFTATATRYDKIFKVWEVKKDGKDWRTVVIRRENEDYSGMSIISFYIDHEIENHAVIIDNVDWDLICFDLEYPPEEILRACLNYLEWVKGKTIDRVETFTYPDYDTMMQTLH